MQRNRSLLMGIDPYLIEWGAAVILSMKFISLIDIEGLIVSSCYLVAAHLPTSSTGINYIALLLCLIISEIIILGMSERIFRARRLW